MGKNILFIDPPGAYSRIVNTGLGYISSSLKKNSTCNFKVLDLNNFSRDRDKILKNVFNNNKVDGVGISLNVGSMHAMPTLLRKIKDYYPNSKIFIGGSHVYLDYKRLLARFEHLVDFAIIGETENTIDDIVECIDDENKLSNIPGVVLKEDSKREVGINRIEDINQLDFPAYEYFESVRRNKCTMEYYPIITSRGCPYSCTFCAGPKISGKKWRFRNPENVVDEIEFALNKYKTRKLDIFDDNFLLDKERAIKIMEMILKRSIKMRLRFGNGVRADKLDEENVRIMKRAGLYEVGMGIETADPELFQTINKGESFENIERAIKLLQKYNVHVGGSFIIGLPGATLEKDIKSIKFVNQMKLNWRYVAWCYFTPYRCTKAYDDIRKEMSEELIDKSYKRGHFTANYIETNDYKLEERIVARSLASRIPPVHSDYNKFKLLKLFIKMEYIILRYRDKNFGFWKLNFEMLERILFLFKMWMTNKINKDAYL